MIVVGIDPGVATTGYGVVRDTRDGIELVDYGIITTPPDMALAQRLLVLHQELQKIIQLHRPESSAVEKLFFQKNVTTAIAVGQARGVALLTLAENRIEVSEYTPLEVKQAVAGYGSADKKQVQYMVKAILNMEKIPSPDDAADALAIAICHLHSIRFKNLEK
ncbi:Holliday junction endonuclease RuvC [Bellilinea caldifistulae]|uniref:Crossover junction endodeoxyribonuclease RuvC n=1 Tax=Bellilinea caldifistulae TaxID=360411 RepID=A0A0P6XJ09_9CHLR|nr:crossover junction endodeoxyribonuclease RuvC [Bellilinea caldifistulae]KPL74990.1 Holliday junction resolvase [Bellilinea caldifistulae]GAP10632.1 Holliday junction endonuclease RuvC [Bellilinea caldifistulae]